MAATGRVSASVLAVIALCACQGEGPKDTAGHNIEYSEWRALLAKDADLNVAENLPNGYLSRLEKRMRNNALSQNRYTLSSKDGRGSVISEYVSVGFYSEHTNNSLRDRDKFVEIAKQSYDKVDDVTPIYWRSNLSGFGAMASKGSVSCYTARTGYKFNDTSFDNDRGNFDTNVFVNFCGTKVDPQAFAAVFANLGKNRK